MRRFSWVLVLLFAGVVGLITEWRPSEWPADLAYDQMYVDAAWAGVDTSRPADQVAVALGAEPVPHTVPIPRTPGVAVVMAPFVSLPAEAAGWVLNLVGTALVVALTRRMAGLDTFETVVLGSAALMLAASAFSFVNLAPVGAALITLSWYGAYAGRSAVWGVPVGIAASVRLWPLLLVVCLAAVGRWRMAGVAATVGAFSTLAGLVAPGVSIPGVIDTLTTGAFVASPSNLSLSAQLPWPIEVSVAAGVIISVVIARTTPLFTSLGAAVVIAILVSPIAWPSYWLAAAPVLGVATRQLRRVEQGAISGIP